MDDPSFIGFYAAIPRTHLDEVEDIVRLYVTRYLITCECSPDAHKATKGWHMHILIQGTAQDYINLIASLKKKYKLQGKTTKNNAHGYGRVRGELRSVERLITYMLKEQPPVVDDILDMYNIEDASFNVYMRYANFGTGYLRDLQLKSFTKGNPNKLRDDIMNFIGDTPPYIEFDPHSDYQLLVSLEHPCHIARRRIVEYFQENTDKAPSRSKVQYYMLHYFVQYNKFALTPKQIAEWFYA